MQFKNETSGGFTTRGFRRRETEAGLSFLKKLILQAEITMLSNMTDQHLAA